MKLVSVGWPTRFDADGVKPIPFSPSQFDYGKNDWASRVPQDLGYAGFRLHFPIKKPEHRSGPYDPRPVLCPPRIA